MSKPMHVLVVDDDRVQLELVQRTLTAFGCQVSVAVTALDMPDMVGELRPDVVLLDVNFPTLSGDLVLGVARRNAPQSTQFVFYSSWDEYRLSTLTRTAGADAYITKSVQGEELVRRLQEMVQRAKERLV